MAMVTESSAVGDGSVVRKNGDGEDAERREKATAMRASEG